MTEGILSGIADGERQGTRGSNQGATTPRLAEPLDGDLLSFDPIANEPAARASAFGSERLSTLESSRGLATFMPRATMGDQHASEVAGWPVQSGRNLR